MVATFISFYAKFDHEGMKPELVVENFILGHKEEIDALDIHIFDGDDLSKVLLASLDLES